MHKNDVVGWVVLAFLILFGIVIFAGIGAAIDGSSSTTVTCNGYGTSVTCTRS